MKENHYSDLILNQTKDLIWAIDSDLCLVYANKAYLSLMKEVTGEEKELNTPILIEGFGEGYVEKWEAYYQRALSGECFEIEEQFYNPDSDEMQYGHITFSPIRDESGKILSVACRSKLLTPDIWEKNYASRLMDASLDVFCTIDEDGKFVFVSAASADHWGYPPEELIGKPYRDLVVEEDIEKTDLVAAEIMEGREFKSFSNRFRKKNGDIAFNLWSARWGHESKLKYCVARDEKDKITEINQLKLLETVISNTTDSILITEAEPLDEPGPRIVYVNQAFTEMTGYTSEEVIGKTPRILQGSDSNYEELKKLGEKLRRWEPSEITVLNYKKSGEPFWVNFAVSPVADEKGCFTHWISIQRDVTEQKKQETEKELLTRISLSFNNEEELVPASMRLCENLYNFGKFDLIELWCPNMEQTQIKLIGHSMHNQDFYEIEQMATSFQRNNGLPGKVWEKEKQIFWNQKQINKYFIRAKGASHLGLQAISIGRSVEYEAVIITKNLKQRWVRVIGKTEQVDGVRNRFIGSLQDITDKKESELRLKSFANNLPGVAFQYYLYPDGTDDLKYVTDGAQEVFGFDAESVMENNNLIWDQIELGGEIDLVKKSIMTSAESKSEFKAQWRYIMPNNELRIHAGHGSPTFLPDKTVVFNSLILDITEEYEREELLTQASKMAKIGSWELNLLDQENDNMYWSPMTREIFEVGDSYKPSLKDSFEFYSDEDKQKVQQAIAKLIEEGQNFDLELLITTKDGKKKWVRSIGKSERVKEKCTKIYGSYQDVHIAKSNENRLKEILDSISDAFYAVDADWNFTYYNKEAENLLKRTADEVLGKNIWEIFSPAKGTILEEVYRRVATTGQSENFEYHYPGDGCWYEISVYSSGGGVSSFFKNIDERRKAAQELQKAYDEKHKILESIGDAFFTVDKEWTVTYWNKQAEYVVGKKREEVLGKHLWEEFPDAIDTDFYRQYHLSMETGKTVNFEEYYETLDMWIEVTAYPSESGLSIYFKDITLRKVADIRLLEANERFELVTKATNDAIWDWDIEKDDFFRSNNIHEIFGSKTSTKLKKSQFWEDPFHPEDLNKLKKSIKKTLKDPQSERWEMEYRIFNDKNEELSIIDRGIIVRNEKGEAIRMVGTMTDLSKQKKLEKELLQLSDSLKTYAKELERSNEELEQFAFITSHDLQEPLRMISSFMDQLKRKYSDRLDDKALQYIYYATDGAKRMKEIIMDLLLYSRANKPTEQVEDVSLNEVVAEYTQLRRKLIAEKDATIEFGTLPVLNTNRAPVTQIINCLLDNALKYAKENTPPRIEVRAKEKKKVWEFAIKDNGIGIDQKFYDKIFIIFQRLHNRSQYDGTGIGLSIVKRSVEFLGGEIWLESTVGEGSTFYFTIPKNKKHRSYAH